MLETTFQPSFGSFLDTIAAASRKKLLIDTRVNQYTEDRVDAKLAESPHSEQTTTASPLNLSNIITCHITLSLPVGNAKKPKSEFSGPIIINSNAISISNSKPRRLSSSPPTPKRHRDASPPTTNRRESASHSAQPALSGRQLAPLGWHRIPTLPRRTVESPPDQVPDLLRRLPGRLLAVRGRIRCRQQRYCRRQRLHAANTLSRFRPCLLANPQHPPVHEQCTLHLLISIRPISRSLPAMFLPTPSEQKKDDGFIWPSPLLMLQRRMHRPQRSTHGLPSPRQRLASRSSSSPPSRSPAVMLFLGLHLPYFRCVLSTSIAAKALGLIRIPSRRSRK